jgi:hypothetical protein
MSTTTTNATDYPAAHGRTVTEGHARYCRENGHASFVRDGVDVGMCPRCGDVTPVAPTCRTCRVRPCSSDMDETGGLSFHATCFPCFELHAIAPWCHTPECSGRVCGTRAVLDGATASTTTETAVYVCERCGRRGTREEWSVASNTASAEHDVARRDAGELDLTDVRCESARRQIESRVPVPAWSVAGARAYVDTVARLTTPPVPPS